VPGGPIVLVDCFNAIPASVGAALRSMSALPGERRLAVLGLMAELGDHSKSEHRGIALLAEELGIEVVGYGTEHYGEAVASSRTIGAG
jgi:UDP-N-acetylmuramoyl-tripeptide--D-alanyl-D-alanine ligase